MNRLLGITGLMAVGKTTIAQEIIKKNPTYIYIDIDTFRRNLLKDHSYQQALKEKIKVLENEKEITSEILNSHIYCNKKNMISYKEVLYHYLFNHLKTYHDKTILIDWALIINDHLEKYFDKIIYVTATKATLMKRMIGSDLSEEEIFKRWKLQELPNLENISNILIISNDNHANLEKILDFINHQECKFTLPKDGGKVIWEITHQCNYHCSYCIFSCNNKKIQNELTTKECFKVIDELAKNNFKHLKITGGEPFLRKDILEILLYASDKLITDISTNASTITEHTVEILNKIPLKMIHVSLDGDKIEHESVRGKNTYDRTIKGLEALKKSKNKIRIGSVIHANNENNLENLINSALQVKADEIIFSIMEPVENQDKSLMKNKSLDTLALYIEKLKQEYSSKIEVNYNFKKQPTYIDTCPAGDKFLFINNYGQVSPCPWVYEKNKNFITKNSLRDYSLKDLLNEKPMLQFLKSKEKGICYGKI